ncbi:MAG: FecR family protein [Endomicrobiia bacterium]
MKKIISKIVFVVLVFVSINYAAGEVMVVNFQGNVVYGVGEKWLAVKKGQLLKENEKIKTLSKSYALLLLPDGTSISLSENTELVIKDLSGDIILNLNNGRTKSKVKPLKLGQKFEIRTPVSVASVRGTVFITGFVDGQAELVVEQGKVIWGGLDAIETTGEITNFVEVNESEKITATEEGLGEKTVLTEEQLKSYDNFFELKIDVGEPESGKTEPQEEKKNETEEVKKELKDELIALKQELKDFVREAKNDNFYINEIVQQTKANDFETSRSLVDVHGNLTRVEQSISRPAADTIEFVNITKRNNYVYKGEFNYGSLIENKPRVDLLTFSLQFNQNLPQKINDFPSFIISKGDDFYPKKMKFELSNGRDKLWSEINFNEVNVIENNKTKKKLETDDFQFWLTNGIETCKINMDYDGELPEGTSVESKDKFYFYEQMPIPVLNVNNNSSILWIQSENYIINNSGRILDETFFKNNISDPFTVLKTVAFESIIFVRRDDNGKPGGAFFNKNIDLVATPDIVVAMAKTLATSASNLKFASEK